MLRLAIPIFSAACASAVLAAAPAAADPDTTGGVPAVEPPALSAQGGLDSPKAEAPATAAQAERERGSSPPSPAATPPATTSKAPAAPGRATAAETPAAMPAAPASSQPAASVEPSSSSGDRAVGGGLPHTGFALAALIAVGTGFLLTGYALRYSRTLDD
jgi:hypothetical protein